VDDFSKSFLAWSTSSSSSSKAARFHPLEDFKLSKSLKKAYFEALFVLVKVMFGLKKYVLRVDKIKKLLQPTLMEWS